MKIYILTCVNEQGIVVSAEPFILLGQAENAMRRQYYTEAEEFDEEDRGYIQNESAFVGHEDSSYYWQIFTEEL